MNREDRQKKIEKLYDTNPEFKKRVDKELNRVSLLKIFCWLTWMFCIVSASLLATSRDLIGTIICWLLSIIVLFAKSKVIATVKLPEED